ncbi:unnamed protein product [Moneuplotes crassus]|uniref:Uncharacterized protein n=1 Tax=Euplotes crassus TaxID=5936 RepID=A0AAD1XZ11_EUPCR|nr:unnamed protein product [Moneuplotes crassus]
MLCSQNAQLAEFTVVLKYLKKCNILTMRLSIILDLSKILTFSMFCYKPFVKPSKLVPRKLFCF